MYVAEEEEQGAEEVVARSISIFIIHLSVSIFSFFLSFFLVRSEVQSAILSIVETGADAVSEGAQETNNGS